MLAFKEPDFRESVSLEEEEEEEMVTLGEGGLESGKSSKLGDFWRTPCIRSSCHCGVRIDVGSKYAGMIGTERRNEESDSAIDMVYTVTSYDRIIVQEEMGGSETRLEMIDPDFDDIVSRARDVERQERSCRYQTTRG